MVDVLTPAQRSHCMSRIRGAHTRPERLVRTLLFTLGFRYRLNVRDLPGKPDLVFPKYHAVVFVHGCFWHGHKCHLFKMPATNAGFWATKIERNRRNDARTLFALKKAGWRVMTIWECSLRGTWSIDLDVLAQEAAQWLRSAAGRKTLRGSPANV